MALEIQMWASQIEIVGAIDSTISVGNLQSIVLRNL